jgi:cell division septal protein FtsQ
MFGRKKTKKGEGKEHLFKREAYIPKKRIQKVGRVVPTERGRKSEPVRPEKSVGRKVLVAMLWLSFIGEVGYVLLFAGFFTITKVEVQRENGESLIGEEQVREFLEGSWQGKWLTLIPKDNLIFIQADSLEKRLAARYPKLEAVQMEKHFPGTLSVRIVEKPYQIVWCSRENCFLVNSEGRAQDAALFFQYPEEQGTSVRIQDTAEAPLEIQKQVLASEDQQFIHDLVSDFSLRTSLSIEGSLERPNLYAKEIRVRTNKGFVIFFNTRLPVSQSLNTLMLVLEKEIPDNDWDKIDYIDLRTENRVYYTRKDRVPEKTEAQKLREEEEEKKRKEEEEKNKSSEG